MPVVPLSPLSSRGMGMDSWLFLPPESVPSQSSLPCILHRLFVVPQAVAALESEHRTQLEQLSSSLEAKHREVRCCRPGL